MNVVFTKKDYQRLNILLSDNADINGFDEYCWKQPQIINIVKQWIKIINEKKEVF